MVDCATEGFINKEQTGEMNVCNIVLADETYVRFNPFLFLFCVCYMTKSECVVFLRVANIRFWTNATCLLPENSVWTV